VNSGNVLSRQGQDMSGFRLAGCHIARHFLHITADDATDMPYAVGFDMLHTMADIPALYHTPVSQCLEDFKFQAHVIKPSRIHRILQLRDDWKKRLFAS
jgi:hypothetical protein